MVITIEELEVRLGGEIPADEVQSVEQLIMDATSVVEGYIGQSVAAPAPDAVRSVVGRMVARALTAEETGAPSGMTGDMVVAGAFTRQRQFSAGSNDGGVWLSSQDKIMLRPFKKRRGVRSFTYGGLR